MVQQQVRAALRTQRGRAMLAGAVVFVALAALAGGAYAVVTDLATSVEISTWTPVTDVTAPHVKIFDKTITNQALVRATQHQLNALPRGVEAGCIVAQPAYGYALRSATHGVTTQEYTGNIDCPAWTVTALSVSNSVEAADNATLYGYNLMTTLHKLTGMPLPSWWMDTYPVG